MNLAWKFYRNHLKHKNIKRITHQNNLGLNRKKKKRKTPEHLMKKTKRLNTKIDSARRDFKKHSHNWPNPPVKKIILSMLFSRFHPSRQTTLTTHSLFLTRVVPGWATLWNDRNYLNVFAKITKKNHNSNPESESHEVSSLFVGCFYCSKKSF